MKKKKYSAAGLFCALLIMIASGCSAEPQQSVDSSASIPEASLVVSDPSLVSGADPEILTTVKVTQTDVAEGGVEVKIQQPVFTGFSLAEELNAKIQQDVDDSMAEVQAYRREQEEIASSGPRPKVEDYSFQADFTYQQNNTILSVVMKYNSYLGENKQDNWIKLYNVDMKSGKYYVGVGDLFQDSEQGGKVLGKLLQDSAKVSMNSDEFKQAKANLKRVSSDQPFYFAGDELMVCFEPSELIRGSGQLSLPVQLSELNESAPLIDAVHGSFSA